MKTVRALPRMLALPLAISILCLNSHAEPASNTVLKPINNHSSERFFQRIAVFPVCKNTDALCDTDDATVAEIVVPSSNGKVLIYTDSEQHQVGLVDISNPESPQGIGTIPLNGEPTSVAVSGRYAFVAVNTSAGDVIAGSEDANAPLKFTRDMSGELAVFDMHTGKLVLTLPLSGQPDSVAASPDGRYLAIAIENERDEDLCVGGLANAGDDEDQCEDMGGEFGIPGQGPAGALDIVTLKGKPSRWQTRRVELTGMANKFPADPEPEYVDINKDNIAVVTLQENNHIALVDLKQGQVIQHFAAGTVNLNQIDTEEEEPALISLTDSEANIAREADGVSWIDRHHFATADEGDLDGGSRGFTLYDTNGNVTYSSSHDLEHLAVRFGHYPDARSGNKGNEPENVDYLKFHGDKMLAIASERSSLVFIYDASNPNKPTFKQVLPAGVGPEGVKAIPQRQLLVAASEVDARDDKIRSIINIYQYGFKAPTYPHIASANRPDGTPIPWSALSGLVAESNNIAYTLYDSFYQQSRIFRLNLSAAPALIDQEIVLKDSNHILGSLAVVPGQSDNAFDEQDLAAMINTDLSVNLDPEGIALASDGSFWVASEGAGSMATYESGRPITSLNLIVKADSNGTITDVITLPDTINAQQRRFGFEGVAELNGKLYVAMQRPWSQLNDPRDADHARIGVYDLSTKSWSFLFYPLDPRESQNGGWVGLSEITALADGRLMVIERDNQAGPDAAIKRLYTFDPSGLTDGDNVDKVLLDDLMDNLLSVGGLVLEKVEGAMVLPNGEVLIVNDNDGVDDSNGETQLLNLGKLL